MLSSIYFVFIRSFSDYTPPDNLSLAVSMLEFLKDRVLVAVSGREGNTTEDDGEKRRSNFI